MAIDEQQLHGAAPHSSLRPQSKVTFSAPPAREHGALIVAGATGVGKSEVAVALAEQVGGEIVGADAFQIYAGMPVLTAQPSPELRARVPHHLIGEIPVTESFSVGKYLELARQRLAQIRGRGRVPVVVGGTGLYIRALLRGLADLPAADAALRAELDATPLQALCERLRTLDPEGARWIDLRNPRRVIRALEVCLLTGRPFSSFRSEWEADDEGTRGVVLLRDRDELARRIDARVAAMFREGVVSEVRVLGEIGETASQTLGLDQIRAHLRGEMTEPECIAAIQQATRQYSKRQATWFRRERSLKPVLAREGMSIDEVIGAIGRGEIS
jgi:tRNA dimethylallyltransferase